MYRVFCKTIVRLDEVPMWKEYLQAEGSNGTRLR